MPRSALGFANVPGPFQLGILRRVARAVLLRIGGVGIQASAMGTSTQACWRNAPSCACQAKCDADAIVTTQGGLTKSR